MTAELTLNGSYQGEPSTKRAKVEDDNQIYKMAYLGPPGTYGQMAAQAFKSCYDIPIDLIPCSSISSIWETSASFHVFPLENTIHGGVTETLDCLLSNLHSSSPSPSSSPSSSSSTSTSHKTKRRIIADLALPISHCLVVRKGVKKEDIRWIRSHEQALGQSSKFIKNHYPSAKLKTYPSTAGAAVSLLNPTKEDLEEGEGAALCSKAAAVLYEDKLDVLYQGTQGIENNFTRFILLSTSPTNQIPSPTTSIPNPNPTEFYTIPSASNLIPFFNKSQIRNIHSRPAPISQTPPSNNNVETEKSQWIYRELRFPTLYFVEVDSDSSDKESQESSLSELGKKGKENGWFLGEASWRVTDDQINAL